MQNNILTEKQEQIIPLLKDFSSQFGLIGDTAIALHMGHRRSIDFDLASIDAFDNSKIKSKIKNIEAVIIDEKGEYTIIVQDIKITFLHYPFNIEFNEEFDGVKVADLLTLSALKAYALGRRTKWKDYVDLYFILKKYSLNQIIERAESIFKQEFNEKIFRSQLGYFEDIDYSEEVEYMSGFETDEETIKKELLKISLEK